MITLLALIILVGVVVLVWKSAVASGKATRFVATVALAFLSTVGAFWIGRKSEQEIIRMQFYSDPRRDISRALHLMDDMAARQKFDRLAECVRILREDWDRSAFFIFESNFQSHHYSGILDKIEKTNEPNKAVEPTPVAVTPDANASAAPSTSAAHL
jgi:hypothetical protein